MSLATAEEEAKRKRALILAYQCSRVKGVKLLAKGSIKGNFTSIIAE